MNTTARLRVALVRARYNPFGGAERFAARAMAALAAEGAEVSVIARAWDSAATEQGQARLLRVDPFHIGKIWRDHAFAVGVHRVLAGEAFDMVQSHERIVGLPIYRAGDGVHASWLEARARVLPAWRRLWLKADPYHRWQCANEARMFRHPALRAVICNSRFVRDDIARRFGVADERLVLIPNGVDLERFSPRLRSRFRAEVRQLRGIPDTDMVWVYVGSGFERKGVTPLLQAMAALKALGQPPRLWIIGGDRRLRAAQTLAQRLGLGERVWFAGPQPDVTPFLGAADAFVLPTLYDPFPNAALEALASGLPAIVGTACGAAERITTGVNGEAVDPLDIAGLAEALHLWSDPLRCQAAGEAARAAVADLTLEAMSQRLVALYQRLLDSGPPRA